MDSSGLVEIKKIFEDPVEMFQSILKDASSSGITTMNLATVDSEFGILNRTVVYRGLTDGAITFVTERNSRKYQNLMENPRVSLTFYLPSVSGEDGVESWQVRLFDASAKELNEEQIARLWHAESVHAKIRSHICTCGEPVVTTDLKMQHDQLLEDYLKGINSLRQTQNYTAFAVVPNRWDFLKIEPFKIADRLQFRRKHQHDKEWQLMHVSA